MLRRELIALVVAVTGVALVIVSTGTPGTNDPGPTVRPGGEVIAGSGEEFDGCRLVEHFDAREILGARVALAPKPAESVAVATCAWETSEEDGGRTLQLSAYRGRQFFTPEAFAADPTFERVEDVGDDAFLITSSGIQLHLVEAEYTVVIAAGGLDGGEEPLDEGTVKRELIDFGNRVARRLS